MDPALCVAQLLAAHQRDGALLAAGYVVAGEHLAQQADPRPCSAMNARRRRKAAEGLEAME
ncbi:hypothetical protein FQK07_01695 [Synechococcus sp. BSF8S]|uniref:hypothetical protein n=1 Tax=Synechococcales TaxID=1890424 RepID=UPI00162921DA|nr:MULTISPECIES: hypothetical protein [unclassified Synechococcus]MBC1259994.1 hypothetical protein [Synechococcus sp. BSF8S]MBC1262584.1 hypothetical protein [Synechococcus sp. BSA11S]